MPNYKVLVDFELDGVTYVAGPVAVFEFAEDVAQPLVDEGKLQAAE